MTGDGDAFPVLLEPSDATARALRAALDAAEPKPAADGRQADKKNYAQRLSNVLAQTIADALRPRLPTITPQADGREQEARVRVAGGGMKRLDVKATDPTLGLILSVSIKTYSFPDYDSGKGRLGRYTKNAVRNDHELRGEASVLHQRQPYAVLIAVMFLPVEAALDGKSDKSSFAHHVQTLKKRAGRGRRPVILEGVEGTAWMQIGGEDPRADLFERVFVGLYESAGPRRGHVRFVDVERPVPQRGAPSAASSLSFDGFVAEVLAEMEARNDTAPSWSSTSLEE